MTALTAAAHPEPHEVLLLGNALAHWNQPSIGATQLYDRSVEPISESFGMGAIAEL